MSEWEKIEIIGNKKGEAFCAFSRDDDEIVLAEIEGWEWKSFKIKAENRVLGGSWVFFNV